MCLTRLNANHKMDGDDDDYDDDDEPEFFFTSCFNGSEIEISNEHKSGSKSGHFVDNKSHFGFYSFYSQWSVVCRF